MAGLKRRKGVLEEVFSRALHADDSKLYAVTYREFNSAKEVTLSEFIELSDNFETVPASRIILVKRGGEILYRTSRRDLLKLLK